MTNLEHAQRAAFHVREAREIAAGIRDMRTAAALQALVDAVEQLVIVATAQLTVASTKPDGET